MSDSYIPMREFEVILHVHVPVGEPDPFEWNWPELTDMTDSDIQFSQSRLVRTYNLDDDGNESESAWNGDRRVQGGGTP